MSTPSERSLYGKLGALAQHARHDPRETTKAARAAFNSRFELAADPDGVLDPAERTRRAGYLRRLYFNRLALRSAQVRRARKGGDAV